jgi:hypothetical protein
MKVIPPRKEKVAAEQLDYVIDWSDWLAEGDSISSQTITVTGTDAVLDAFQNSHDGTASTIWLRNGTAGGTYVVSCRVTTGSTPARIGERAFEIVIR